MPEEITDAEIVPEPAPEQTMDQKANACLNEINTALRKYGFDIQVFHELATLKNAQGNTEISIQHIQKFVPIVPKEKTDGK